MIVGLRELSGLAENLPIVVESGQRNTPDPAEMQRQQDAASGV